MRLLPVNLENLQYLHDFIENMGSSSANFRYFLKREPEKVLLNHLVTVLLFDQEAVGYGHLDKEEGKIWLGICVKEGNYGKGYGKTIMKELIASYEGDIYLSVDKDNHRAHKLYELFGFKKIRENDTMYYMIKRGTNVNVTGL